MQSKFRGFQEKRMHIFGELVKRYWNGQLNNVGDLKDLAGDIKDQYGFSDEDIPFIEDHIRVAMGLNPTGNGDFRDELDIVKASGEVSPPVIAKIEGPCEYCGERGCRAVETCKYEAHIYDRKKGPVIVNDKCLSCGQCVTGCEFGALADKIEFMPLIDLLKDETTMVYAAVAPAIAGQFGDDVTMGQLRTGLKLLGFQDMIEVALFADILTIREAFEFNHLVKKEEDFFLTSCCCPVWFNLIKKHYPDIFKFMSPSVSPMIASGRILKELYDNVRVV
ncbi:MAG TPA: iron hydrogenase, partial [Clostridiales bacterium]|nr:iron hydrogenase [Clostridiales bacterium]